MKRKIGILAIFSLLIFLVNGCILSIHPIYTKDKLVVIKDLHGAWLEKIDADDNSNVTQEREYWTFKLGKDKKYLLIHQDREGLRAAFDVHVIKLGEDYFMDLYPTDMPSEVNDPWVKISERVEKGNSFSAIHFLPVHTFAKLEFTPKELKISMFDPEFLERLLEHQQIRIKNEKTADGYVLTASPQELQKFASKYAHTEEAFLDEPMVLTK